MFHAFIIVCAASFSGEVDRTRCVIFDDTWGPYITKENCDIRANQMLNDIKKDNLSIMIAMMLEFPSMLYSQGRCVSVHGEAI